MEFGYEPFHVATSQGECADVEKVLRAARVAYRKRVDASGPEFIIEVQSDFAQAATDAYVAEFGGAPRP